MTRDEIVGRNVRSMREGGLSQDLVAHEMREHFHRTEWRRQTVIRVEQGKRSLKLHEAVDLAGVLGCDLDMLTKGLDTFTEEEG